PVPGSLSSPAIREIRLNDRAVFGRFVPEYLRCPLCPWPLAFTQRHRPQARASREAIAHGQHFGGTGPKARGVNAWTDASMMIRESRTTERTQGQNACLKVVRTKRLAPTKLLDCVTRSTH